jgi:hypothetical protein
MNNPAAISINEKEGWNGKISWGRMKKPLDVLGAVCYSIFMMIENGSQSAR